MVTVIVDGYNVIHAVPALARELDRSLDAARTALIGRCAAYRARRGDVARLYVVFDGQGTDGGSLREPQRGVLVLFSRQQEEADERILHLIRSAAAGRSRSRFVVVSNDNQVANNARALGAQLVSAIQFSEPVRPARSAAAVDEKALLSSQEAARITAEYRKHLEGRSAR